MGQAMTSSQFYLYGRSRFTATGWAKHSAKYATPDVLETMDLSGRVFVVTGANSGIGKEITAYLAGKGGKVYMVCRNPDRAEKARQEIEERTAAVGTLVPVIGDCSLKSGVESIASTIIGAEAAGIDALVCNAGVLKNDRTLTDDGVEVTFACHLVYGSYYLSKLLVPALRARAEAGGDPRVVYTSSGGMYNTAFPAWNVAASEPDANGELPPYDGQLSYAYAKRGQVLLAEELAKQEAGQSARITYVTAHPGWVRTPAVDEAYGEKASYLEPMRDLWQGSEGISWLAVAPSSELEPGAFYLDRKPQVKHLAGPFFSEGSFTKNKPGEVAELMTRLGETVGTA